MEFTQKPIIWDPVPREFPFFIFKGIMATNHLFSYLILFIEKLIEFDQFLFSEEKFILQIRSFCYRWTIFLWHVRLNSKFGMWGILQTKAMNIAIILEIHLIYFDELLSSEEYLYKNLFITTTICCLTSTVRNARNAIAKTNAVRFVTFLVNTIWNDFFYIDG